MRILAIETSCDETAVCVLEAENNDAHTSFQVLGNALYSQVEKHAPYGGVYPSLAKREHAANLTPLLSQCLTEAALSTTTATPLTEEVQSYTEEVLVREHGAATQLIAYLGTIPRPPLDAIAVTYGPGLEPALWVGINFARALAHAWDLPIIPVNHLEGHLVASAVLRQEDQQTYDLSTISFPALGLVISGGHTEFIHMTQWGAYDVVGSTRDDSVGEAYDKAARMLGLPYPGGPEISRLAERGRPALLRNEPPIPTLRTLPRPMMHTKDLDVSFSGLKTAVKYLLRDIGEPTDAVRAHIAADFEAAVVQVLRAKTNRALETYHANTFLLGGGVAVDPYIRKCLAELFTARNDSVVLRLPAPGLSTDNAIMIGMAGYLNHIRNTPVCTADNMLPANGSLSLQSI